jgi:hypothetical protein
MMAASSMVVTGVRLDGFTTTQFPAASACAIFNWRSITDSFHGVMRSATPWGSRRSLERASAISRQRNQPGYSSRLLAK